VHGSGRVLRAPHLWDWQWQRRPRPGSTNPNAAHVPSMTRPTPSSRKADWLDSAAGTGLANAWDRGGAACTVSRCLPAVPRVDGVEYRVPASGEANHALIISIEKVASLLCLFAVWRGGDCVARCAYPPPDFPFLAN